MSAARAALIITALLFSCIWAGLLLRLWCLRRSFKIAARAPGVVGICGLSTLAVLSAIFLHWILLLDGKGLPCFIMFLVSYLWIAACMLPYCLRAVRLVVFYNTEYRLKYAQYVQKRNLVKVSMVAGTAIAIGAFCVLYHMPERYSRDKYGCYFFNERRAIELTLILGVIPTVFVMCKLMKGHDVFGIGPEIVNVTVPIMIGGVIKSTVQELLTAGVLEGSRGIHLCMEMVVVVCFTNLLVWSVLVPVGEYHGFCGARKMYVVPVEGLTTRSADINNEGVLDYAEEGGEVAELFGDFCRQCLCVESWDFILDTVAYKGLGNPHEQFVSFIRIMDQYLRSTSPQGINLGSTMKKHLLQFQTRPSFIRLHEDSRRDILDAAVKEIVLMLEQNILAKFKLTPAMRQLSRKKRQSKGGV